MSHPKAYDPEYGYQFQLFCRADSRTWEPCDYAKDYDELDCLLAEYGLSYGAEWEFKWEQLPEEYWTETTKNLVPTKQIRGATVFDVTGWFIINREGMFRFVNHDYKIATVGFSSSTQLLVNKDIFRADNTTLRICRERYKKLFPEE